MPDFFTAEGYSVVTVQGEYGSKDVPDERWLHDAGVHGWVVVTKDSHIRQRPKEKSAFLKAKARVVCLTPGGLTMAEQVNCFRDNLGAIERWWDEPGPWLLVLRRGGVEKLSW